MKPSTNIREVFSNNVIEVPKYQRAYSWETVNENHKKKTHTDVFLKDLEEYNKSKSKSPYYFGHFLFEEKDRKIYYVIDGQQRLTTIVIFMSALFEKLQTFRNLTENEEEIFEDMIKRKSKIRFATVDYDNLIFKDFIINKTKTDTHVLKTVSAKRFVLAFNFFREQLKNKEESYVTQMIKTVSEASCSTHLVLKESEAVQMFIFQNNRGKTPSNLEIVKAQFMYYAHLHGKDDAENIIEEIKNRFENVYKSISAIENNVSEDDVLTYTLRVFFNSLNEGNIDKINKRLSDNNSLNFIIKFTFELANTFEKLEKFFSVDERKNFNIHSLIALGGYSIAMPFIIKAYKYNLDIETIGKLCKSLEKLVLRHRIIGTRAIMTSRINDVYKKFTLESKGINLITERIEYLSFTYDWWWNYWNKQELKKSLQGKLNHSLARFILWKYENHLLSEKNIGYSLKRFSDIGKPHLEHIAPSKEPKNKPHGYGKYDEDFKDKYLNCLGNYLLLSGTHNISLSNSPFAQKISTYTHLEQQREIKTFINENQIWGIEQIENRKDKIINFILEKL